ncbi:uncharacterized protein [Pyrus communis]|uniref:uncharacterized protein n=1 Tax=Pyrus communis TaxID=23211 RepID=UPI0035C0EE9C
MVNLAKLDFAAPDIIGNNYLTWVLDTKIHLKAGNLGDTSREENNSSSQDRAKTMIFIRRHLDEGLKNEYLMVEDLLALWKQQYRAHDFTEYNQLISVLLVIEQNNDLLMKNHQTRPTGSAPFPEVNVASLEVNATSSGGINHKRRRDHKRGRWNKKGKNHGGQLNITHLDVSDFIVEMGNEVYRSD